jgi:branched-chain amino acid transport system ATP-binding protein
MTGPAAPKGHNEPAAFSERAPLLRVEDLCAGYGDMPVLWDVSLAVYPGELVAVIGSNGAGKTTLLHTVAGLLRPTRGTIRLDGAEIQALPAHARPDRGLALVPEGGQPFPHMTVRENLEVGAYRTRARARGAANLERAWALFPRLREREHQLAGTLSGGERQMLAIARALMSEPRLLLLDEPSLGLAPLVVEQVFAVLDALRRDGLTILLVEQNVQQTLELADRAYVLESGRVVRAGEARALLADPAVAQHFLGL